MISLSFEGQMLIDFAMQQRIYWIDDSLYLINQGIRALKNGNIEEAKERVIKAYELVFKSCGAAFIVVDGLIPLVLNEEADARIHNKLDSVTKELYAIYSELFRFSPQVEAANNVVSYQEFQLRRIYKKLCNDARHLK